MLGDFNADEEIDRFRIGQVQSAHAPAAIEPHAAAAAAVGVDRKPLLSQDRQVARNRPLADAMLIRQVCNGAENLMLQLSRQQFEPPEPAGGV